MASNVGFTNSRDFDLRVNAQPANEAEAKALVGDLKKDIRNITYAMSEKGSKNLDETQKEWLKTNPLAKATVKTAEVVKRFDLNRMFRRILRAIGFSTGAAMLGKAVTMPDGQWVLNHISTNASAVYSKVLGLFSNPWENTSNFIPPNFGSNFSGSNFSPSNFGSNFSSSDFSPSNFSSSDFSALGSGMSSILTLQNLGIATGVVGTAAAGVAIAKYLQNRKQQ